MAVMKARLFPFLFIFVFIFFSPSVSLASLPFTFGDETLKSPEYDNDCIARICERADGIDLQNCKDQYAEYCEAVRDYKRPISELAQCQRRCEEMRELRQIQQCQSRCLQEHLKYQQCMQICQGSGTSAARSPELCRKVCLKEQGGEYYFNLWYSNPDYDRGKVHLKCMDRCKTSHEPQLCMRICKQEYREKEEKDSTGKRDERNTYMFDDL